MTQSDSDVELGSGNVIADLGRPVAPVDCGAIARQRP